MIWGSQHADIMLVLISFSEMRVFVSDAFFQRFLRKVEWGKAYMGESHELKTVEILIRK